MKFCVRVCVWHENMQKNLKKKNLWDLKTNIFKTVLLKNKNKNNNFPIPRH